jgi:hypothetical protein
VWPVFFASGPEREPIASHFAQWHFQKFKTGRFGRLEVVSRKFFEPLNESAPVKR